MRSKDDLLKKLRSDPMFRQALEMAKTEKERKAIIAITEDFVGGFAEVLLPMMQKVESDPVLKERLARALLTGEDVVTDNEPVSSSSKG